MARVLTEFFFPSFGVPEQVLTDRGAQFTGKLMKTVESIYQVKHAFTTAYHPQSDGRVERANRTLQAMLSKTSAALGGTWEEHLGNVLHAYNTTVQTSTGLTPYYVMFGRESKKPSDSVLSRQPSNVTWSIDEWIDRLPHCMSYIWALAKKAGERSQQQQKTQFDKHRDATPTKITVGNRVWLLRNELLSDARRKMALPWVGPYEVLEVNEKGFARIRRTLYPQSPAITVTLERLSVADPAIKDDTPVVVHRLTNVATKTKKARKPDVEKQPDVEKLTVETVHTQKEVDPNKWRQNHNLKTCNAGGVVAGHRLSFMVGRLPTESEREQLNNCNCELPKYCERETPPSSPMWGQSNDSDLAWY